MALCIKLVLKLITKYLVYVSKCKRSTSKSYWFLRLSKNRFHNFSSLFSTKTCKQMTYWCLNVIIIFNWYCILCLTRGTALNCTTRHYRTYVRMKKNIFTSLYAHVMHIIAHMCERDEEDEICEITKQSSRRMLKMLKGL